MMENIIRAGRFYFFRKFQLIELFEKAQTIKSRTIP